ncbi:probable methylenetetrahydrofolate reductase (NADPH) [Hetaerina americana]|uniref:probable methylenetetrahydrofolate reductase (NADPH) n=1 Tax=Hetaerina americana TaxID=62018 RepID=UPI003A7F598C
MSLLAVFDENENPKSTNAIKNCLFRKPGISGRFKKLPLAQDISSRIKSKDIFFSLEFLPPRNHYGVVNLHDRLHFIQDGGTLFCSITWHTNGCDPASEKETSSSSFASSIATSFNFHTMLHLAANDLTKDKVLAVLKQAQLHGIRTVLALRGDRNPGWLCPKNGFRQAVDLVRYIREKFGDIFTIGVAGYPAGHHEAVSYKHDLKFLKEKVDAGADFVISQIFFSADLFLKFYQDCKTFGINVPVIPGILPILNYPSLLRIAGLCHLEIPPNISNCLSCISHNEEAVTNFGIQYAINLARDILKTGSVPAIHFFTLNREKPVITICKQLGLWTMEPPRYRIQEKQPISNDDNKKYSVICLNNNYCNK